jgi:hypothetical protein
MFVNVTVFVVMDMYVGRKIQDYEMMLVCE